MVDNKKSSKFGLGMIFGLLTGAVAGLFLAPKSGKRLQQDVKKVAKKARKLFEEKELEDIVRDVFGKVTEETMSLFEYTIDSLADRLSDLKGNLGTINRDKYKELVSETVETVREEKNIPDDLIRKLKKYLEGDYQRLTGVKKQKKATAKKRG